MNAKNILALAFAGLFAVTAIADPTGVFVNGVELDDTVVDSGPGWVYNQVSCLLELNGAGPVTLSGENWYGAVQVLVPAGVTNTVTLSDLTLASSYDCAFALEANACVSLLLEGENILYSDSNRAGLEVPPGASLSITNAPGADAATLAAYGGSFSAGIGGSDQGASGAVNIRGGTITATGGYYGAGIGGGYEGNGGTVNISGGSVIASGNHYSFGAGIGGGCDGAGGTVNISGGTVVARGAGSSADIGPGSGHMTSGANTFTGGSIGLVNTTIAPTPSNGTAQVACVTFSGFGHKATVTITGLAGYGVHDIFADTDGAIHLWLPDGDYDFMANDRRCTVKIKNGAGPSGVTVNGEDAAFGPEHPDTAGWDYDAATRTVSLTGAGPFTLSGINERGLVRVLVPDNTVNTVTLSNLTLRATDGGQCAFALEAGANVSLVLAGANTLASGDNRAGLEVPAGASLAITNAPGGNAGSLTATGGDNGAGIGGGNNGGGGTVKVHGGTVDANGGDSGAGIGGGNKGAGGTVTVSGGTVAAKGGYYYGAGIGGGNDGAGGTVTVSGGTVVAEGGYYGAGIGGGYYGAGGAVTVSGGRITATGGTSGGAGIGGGYYGAGGTIAISNGTVAARGQDSGADIGPGNYGTGSGSNTFTGGSIGLTAFSVALAPSNGTTRVGCAIVSGFEPNESVTITGLPSTYGVNGIFADANGTIYLWLPDGDYSFTANNRPCSAKIKNGVGACGVTVNGDDVAFGSDDPVAAGWSYDATTRILELTGAGPFTLSGNNEFGHVCVVASDAVVNAVTLSNLTLRATDNDQCAFALGKNANVSLVLAGANTLDSGANRAGLEVPAGTSLAITNAPDDSTGSLTATGGSNGAGIGGGYDGAGGTVEVYGGVVTATGGSSAAGIGGGANSYWGPRSAHGGAVTISGGTVTATGSGNGAGIGGGDYGAGGTVSISGGKVSATGGDYGSGIGGGYEGTGGTATIAGGTVVAQGGYDSADIGPGPYGATDGSNAFVGGSIHLINAIATPAPSNGTAQVACAKVSGFAPNAPVAITGLASYGVNDIVADNGGAIYLWLPDGTHTFTANGKSYTVQLQDGVGPIGVTVNGDDIAFTPAPGAGWNYDAAARTLWLAGTGPFTLSGVNEVGEVVVVVADNLASTVTLSNLTLKATADNQCAFALGQNAQVSLFLAGTNTLESGRYRAGLEVASGRTLSVAHAPGAAAAALIVKGGSNGAGIGGGRYGAGGTITIAAGAVTATGGYNGAGIGGGGSSDNPGGGGAVTISGGTVVATGVGNGAGVGGGNRGAGGAVTITGGSLTAAGGQNGGAGIGSGASTAGASGMVVISNGTVTAIGGEYGGAGIGGGAYATNPSGTIEIAGGTVMAQGESGAAIGGGSQGASGMVAISGGTVTAQSVGGAGIGGGNRGAGGTVAISGGTVVAQSEFGAGIGGGNEGAGGTTSISAGTVFAQSTYGTDIGPGAYGTVAGANTFTGGSTRLSAFTIASAPSNTTVQVGCAIVTGFASGEQVAITPPSNLPAYYGITDIVADGDGAIYLWLPDGDYAFTANGRACTAKIKNGSGPTGVTVNGEEAAFGPANPATAGWSFDGATRTVSLAGAGPFTLAGANVVGGVRFAVPEGVANTVELANLTLRATANGQCAFELGTNAVVALVLAGSNTLASGSGRAGLEVAAGRTLSITNAPGDATGALTATGGYGGAGIGGGSKGIGGAVTIRGGIVTACGGEEFAAGIGGGGNGGGGAVTISGGTVTAIGARLGAGIGTGGYAAYYGRGDGGTVTISGGTVTATGGELSAGIGGGDNDPAGSVAVSGGRVTATGGRGAAGIGGGGAWRGTGGAGAALTISGGTVFATGGAGGGPGIGGGVNDADDGGTTPNVSGTSTFIGGSIRIDGGYAAAAPSNGAARVWCVTVPNLTPGEAIMVASLDPYGVDDLFADDVGKLYLWLPNGSYAFTADGTGYTATVADAATTATGGGGIPAPVFATDGSGIVVSGTTLSITITNVQGGIWYTLYAVDTLGGAWDWQLVQSVCAADDSDLTFANVSATPTKRFFKVVASETQP